MEHNDALTLASIGHRFPDASIESEALASTGIAVKCLGHLPKSEALAKAKDAAGILLGASFALDAVDLKMLTRCRVIVRYGVGVDNVDVPAAQSQGIIVCNIPDYAIAEVADHTLALLLALARGLDIWATAVREGQWGAALPKVSIRRLSDTTLGVIGVGRIGEAVIARARAFWHHILVFDPYVTAEKLDTLQVSSATLEELLAKSDFVTIHVPSTPATQGMLSTSRLQTMKKGAVLVNCSRGDVVDEGALAASLATGHLRRAGLDVFTKEPPDPAGLAADPAVWPTPHVAWLSTEALQELRWRAAEEAGRVLCDEPPHHALNL